MKTLNNLIVPVIIAVVLSLFVVECGQCFVSKTVVLNVIRK